VFRGEPIRHHPEPGVLMSLARAVGEPLRGARRECEPVPLEPVHQLVRAAKCGQVSAVDHVRLDLKASDREAAQEGEWEEAVVSAGKRTAPVHAHASTSSSRACVRRALAEDRAPAPRSIPKILLRGRAVQGSPGGDPVLRGQAESADSLIRRRRAPRRDPHSPRRGLVVRRYRQGRRTLTAAGAAAVRRRLGASAR
jgi:hypothetical protein